jgi:hypothetical protein
MDLVVRPKGAMVVREFEPFFRQTFPGVARAAALVARDAGTGQELAQEAFFRLYERWSRPPHLVGRSASVRTLIGCGHRPRL